MSTTELVTDDALALAERLQGEGLIGLSHAARLFGQYRSAHTHPATVGRWCMHGAKLPDGTRLRLEAVRISGRLATSKAACLRFIARQTAALAAGADAAGEREAVKPPAGQRNRKQAWARADAELERMGC